MVTVGRFSYENGTITGPAQYMKDQGNDLIDRINAGTDEILNMTAHYSPSPIQAVLVRLQTDYAGWIGVKQLLDSLR